jgi:hypothetical protein
MEVEAPVGEGEEFHILCADELKAREPVTLRTLYRLMNQTLSCILYTLITDKYGYFVAVFDSLTKFACSLVVYCQKLC